MLFRVPGTPRDTGGSGDMAVLKIWKIPRLITFRLYQLLTDTSLSLRNCIMYVPIPFFSRLCGMHRRRDGPRDLWSLSPIVWSSIATRNTPVIQPFRIIQNIPTLLIAMMFMHLPVWILFGTRPWNTIVQVSHFLDCLPHRFRMHHSMRCRNFRIGIMIIRISPFLINYPRNPNSGVPWSPVLMHTLGTF